MGHGLVCGDIPISNIDNPPGMLGNGLLMRHQYYRPAFSIQPLKDIHHFQPGARIQGSCWFVGKYNGGIVNQSTSNSYPLLLTSRKLIRPVMEPVAEADYL